MAHEITLPLRCAGQRPATIGVRDRPIDLDILAASHQAVGSHTIKPGVRPPPIRAAAFRAFCHAGDGARRALIAQAHTHRVARQPLREDAP